MTAQICRDAAPFPPGHREPATGGSTPFADLDPAHAWVVYWSVDKGGNTEAQRTGYVNINAASG